MEVNIREAKIHLSKLIQRVLAGEEVIIAKACEPLVRLVRVEAQRPVLGSARGRMKLPRGWDKPLDEKEINELFSGDVVHR